ncbi:8224_t:CDS:10 [Ambispora leptoticha]|uniref:8224_t:CDS:1 n=1 Tax=Ambispora leptoticha TaxID=144679 RepID=A0A9N9DBT9_9GLOM|nr:8224_t:CDS:10 [Ambispora leptoticha]
MATQHCRDSLPPRPRLLKHSPYFELTSIIHPALAAIDIKDWSYERFVSQIIVSKIRVNSVEDVEQLWLRSLKVVNSRKEIPTNYRSFIKELIEYQASEQLSDTTMIALNRYIKISAQCQVISSVRDIQQQREQHTRETFVSEQVTDLLDSTSNDAYTGRGVKRKADMCYGGDQNSPTVMMLRRREEINHAIPDETPTTSSTGSLYVPSSADSVSSDESVQKGKRYYLDYFVGPGLVSWDLKESSARWFVKGADISEKCLMYRNAVIDSCKTKSTILTSSEELALSHIFLFHEDDPNGLREYFDLELWESLFAEFRTLYAHEAIPSSVLEIFTNISKIACDVPNHNERKMAVKEYLQRLEIDDKDDKVMEEVIRNIIENEQSSFTTCDNEDTHAHKNVAPVVEPFFKDKKTCFDWANRMSESSAIAKKRFDPVLMGVKPDFTVRTTNPKKHVELLIGEIKPPKVRDALSAVDLVYLGKTMKNALDKSIGDGVDDLVICGIQIIGRAYVMDLRFDGIYRMILIGEFELPKAATSWCTILGCYRVLATIRDIVNEEAAHYQLVTRSQIDEMASKKVKWTKPQFHSPMKIPYNNGRHHMKKIYVSL